MTEWPARRLRAQPDVLAGGRRVEGRYVCQGKIAHLMAGTTPPIVEFPPGYRRVEARPDLIALGARARTKLDESRAPATRRPKDGSRAVVLAVFPNELPVRRRCPTCGCVALVTIDVLA